MAPNSGLFLLKHSYCAQILFPVARKKKKKHGWKEGTERERGKKRRGREKGRKKENKHLEIFIRSGPWSFEILLLHFILVLHT